MLNLAVLLDDSAREVPERAAIIYEGTRLSYAALQAAANQVANGLVQAGIRQGDTVALSCQNLPFFVIAYYGILKAGAVVLPLNVLLKPREIAYHLADGEAKAYFCQEGSPDLPIGQMGFTAFQEVESCTHFCLMTNDVAAPSPIAGATTLAEFMQDLPTTFDTIATNPDATAVILYTSGTTGKPKGAELTHMNMLLNARLSETMYPKVDHDVHLIALPLFHSFGQSVQMNAGIYNRATLVLQPRFSPEGTLRLMEEEHVSIFAGVPTMYWALLNYPGTDTYDLQNIARHLRISISGGAAMPVEVMRAFNEKFQVTILEGYGLSETSPVATFNRLDRTIKPGSIGLPVWGVEVRLVDQNDEEVGVNELGEVVIRGHNIMKGYYKRAEATADAMRNGWFHTGDIGRRDEDGYFYIADRVKDMIIRGGFNVYPREIEEVLMTHPAVSIATVIGVPHERHGEEIKAFVILKPATTISEAELIAWSKQTMADYKYPRQIEFRTALPMTATGKILKSELRQARP
ncbi:long-chain-fatty-acid--CoA ligase [Dictyobacter vulcani]|uniref:Long-chain-fatty-acid--CoA ligase n=1 Tax=Dictyobacter vulcani TaxID=2607529 RepID=A0A5J4KS72_9CHLR|nr:long-chain fatty acid--CoA ligase [Dictyobacter vulcani]GER89952.1 long-chain-fatty-acid--CoA ligase [Dictyobacter vulcani]